MLTKAVEMLSKQLSYPRQQSSPEFTPREAARKVRKENLPRDSEE
jgi:hypothetical protein